MREFTKKIIIVLSIILVIVSMIIVMAVYLHNQNSNSSETITPTATPTTSEGVEITQTNATIRIVENQTTTGGITADIYLTSEARISAVDIVLVFPTDALEFISTQSGNYFPEVIEVSNNVDAQKGQVYISTASLNPQSGDGLLSKVNFSSYLTQPGQSNQRLIIVDSVIASSPDYDIVNIDVVSQ